MIFPHPLFTRKLSFNTLVDLSEKCELPPSLPLVGRASALRIAIIGTGITGVSAACQILDAGFDCHLFEAGNEGSVGGIWTKVNPTSSLQIHSSFYTFHPAVEWKTTYPNRAEILGQVHRLWNLYGLGSRATFNCRVENTYKVGEKWVINDPSNGYFDGIVTAVGTCGDTFAPVVLAQDSFKGKLIHSSELHRKEVEGKNVLIVGGGASAVEALEFACDNGAATAKVLARSEKWFLPRIPVLNAFLACFVGDKFGILAWFIEFLLRIFFYADLWEIAPPFSSSVGIFSGTPICNSRVLELVREGRASWLRGDVQQFTTNGIQFSRRPVGVPQGGPGQVGIEEGDVCILATGFRRPSLAFLPKDISTSKYNAPNWYLQCFPTEDATVCATNCTWRDGIGSIGGFQGGVYTRILLVFLLDPSVRPSTWMMRTWVDVINTLKAPLPGGGLSFATTGEALLWFVTMISVQPGMWRHFKFILSGTGSVGGGYELKGGLRVSDQLPMLNTVR